MKTAMHIPILQDRLQEELERYRLLNKEASATKCKEFLKELEGPLQTNLKMGKYFQSGGSAEFEKDLEEIAVKYKKQPHLGVQVSCLP